MPPVEDWLKLKNEERLKRITKLEKNEILTSFFEEFDSINIKSLLGVLCTKIIPPKVKMAVRYLYSEGFEIPIEKKKEYVIWNYLKQKIKEEEFIGDFLNQTINNSNQERDEHFLEQCMQIFEIKIDE